MDETVAERIRNLRAWFTALQPQARPEASYKTIVIVCPNVKDEDAESQVHDLQRRLKREFLPHGVMIGQFYKDCATPGIWSDGFRPFQSPWPLLAIRNMVPPDSVFYLDEPEFLLPYLETFAEEIPARLRRLIVERVAAGRPANQSPRYSS